MGNLKYGTNELIYHDRNRLTENKFMITKGRGRRDKLEVFGLTEAHCYVWNTGNNRTYH